MRLVQVMLGVVLTAVWIGMVAMDMNGGASLPGDVQVAREIPEPMTFLLVAAGGVLMHRRRRRK